MKPLRLLILLLLLATAAACGSTRVSIEEPTSREAQQAPSGESASQPKQKQSAALATKNVVRTETLTPQPIKIALGNLPQPFATNSASKSPNVVAVPENPTLKVPMGFEVNVYADDLDAPRWLTLTPSGDVLVNQRGASKSSA